MRRDQRGSIFATTVILIGGLLAISQAGLIRSLSEMRTVERYLALQGALYQAEAGIDRGLRATRISQGFASWTDAASNTLCTTPPCASLTSPEGALILAIDTDGPLVTLRSTGTVQGISQTTEMVIEIPNHPFTQGVLGGSSVRLEGNSLLDSYNSSLGAYTPSPAVGNRFAHGHVRTNSTSSDTLRMEDVIINGDVITGPGVPSSVVIRDDGGNTVSGSKYPATETVAMPTPTPPQGLVNAGDLSIGNQAVPLAAGTYWFQNLTSSGGSLTTTGPVMIYVSCKVDLEGGQLAGFQNLPTNLTIQVISDPACPVVPTGLDIRNNTQVYGNLYAPNASVDFRGGSDFWGSLIAKSVRVREASTVHYDEASTGAGAGPDPVVHIREWRQL